MNPQRCAVYIRVSSEEQAKFGDSMRDQKERCIEYINGRKDALLQGVYVDDGVSGQKIDRDDFSRLMDVVANNEIDLIIFTKLDRWFRNLRHYLNTQAILEEHNVAWTAIDQPYFDTSTPHGRAFVAQSMMWAELEAQNDGVRIRDVFSNKVKYGEAITGKVPRGYRIENKHLVLSEEAPAIHDSFMYYLKTNSMSATIKYMQEKYQIRMTLQNLKASILQNEKYTGRYRDNESYCPRLISDEDFARVQQLLSKNIRSSQKYDYIFSGLLVCAECGRKLGACHINVISKRKNGHVYRYRYPAYECKRYRAYHDCVNGGEIREVRVEEYLLDNIQRELANYIADVENKEAHKVDNRVQKAAIRRKLERLKDLYLNEVVSLEEYKVDRMRLEQDLESLPDTVEPKKDFSSLRILIESDLKNIYQNLDNIEKRRFWRGFIREIRISKSAGRKRNYEILFL